MSHTIRDKQKLLNRVRRIRGQVDAIERALETEMDCEQILQLLTSCRGALNGLVVVVVEDHIRTHFVAVDGKSVTENEDKRERLIDIVHSYFK